MTIKNWNLEIEKAKEEVIINKEFAWQQEWKDKWFKEHKDCKSRLDMPSLPRMPKEVLEVKAWFITSWDTGFVVCDMQELMKQPKKKRDKILALGGIR